MRRLTPLLALCLAEDARFIVMDAREEALHQNRYCLAYALGVSQRLGRAFVAPSYVDGKVRDPDARAPDALDFYDVRAAAGDTRVVRTRALFATHPLAKVGARSSQLSLPRASAA